MPIMSVDLGPRPDSNEADRAMDASARRPIGAEKSGRIVVLSPEIGTGAVQEYDTARLYRFSRDFHPSFDSLRVGMSVTFYESNTHTVAKFGRSN